MMEKRGPQNMDSKNTCYSCEVRASDIAGRGTFATSDLGEGVELFREDAFLVSHKVNRPRTPRRRDHFIPLSPTRVQDVPAAAASLDALPKIRAGLSTISIQHKHCPPSVRLAPTDTGGTLSGSEDTYWFARAYAASSSATRAAVLELDTFGGGESHAVFEVVRAESCVLRQFDHDLQSIPAHELECAIQRYWANTFGVEGALHNRGSRFNHSCSPNCTRVLIDGGAERSFITLKPVAAGEELTLSYLPSEMEVMGTVVRRRHLWLSRGFLCRCDRCLHPQDDLRQVACPDCAASAPPRTRRRGSALKSKRARRASGGGGEGTPLRSPLSLPFALGSPWQLTPPPAPEEAEFADWWNQSGVWVCRRCGWCSDPSGRLHHAEGVLSAEVFSRVMADAVVAPPPLPPTPTPLPPPPPLSPLDGTAQSGEEALGMVRPDGPRSKQAAAAKAAEEEVEEEKRWRRQARRDTMQGMLDASLALVGGRHWASFSCARMRLVQELSFVILEEGVEEEGEAEEKRKGEGEKKEEEEENLTLSSTLPSSPPASTLLLTSTPSSVFSQSRTTSPPLPPQSSPGMGWALRELNGLWRWLTDRLSGTNHPPAYYLFEVVCDILDAHGSEIAELERAEVAGRAGSGMEGWRLVLTSVEAWASVYGDEQQRLRLRAAVAAAAGRRDLPLTIVR